MKRWRRWSPFFAWFGVGLLAVGTCVVATRVALTRAGHAKIERILGRHHGEGGLIPDARGPTVASTPPQNTTPRGISVRELPLIGRAFTADPKRREEFANLIKELQNIERGLGGRLEEGVMVHRHYRLLEFKSVLANLGIQVPEEMTEEQAAAAFLQYMDTFAETLAQLRADASQPWDWGESNSWGATESDPGRYHVAELLRRASAAVTGIMQARWRTGQTSEAWSDWETLRLLAARAADDPTSSNIFFSPNVHTRVVVGVSMGIALNAWSNEELAHISEVLASFNALDVTRHDIDVRLASLAEFSQRPADVRGFFAQNTQRGDSIVRQLSAYVMGDQYIQDNLGIIAADYEFARSQLDVANRLYVPPPAERTYPSQEIVADNSPLTDFYFMPYNDLTCAVGNSFADAYPGLAVRNQVATDTARLAAALEGHRRAAGEYPDTLEAVAAAFPNGLPHDVATGKPYFYERSPDGAYRIWSTGIDQVNDSGDRRKDILFTLPKP